MGEYFCDICKFYDDDVSSKFVICCHTCIVPTNQCIFLHLLWYRQRNWCTIAKIVAYAGEQAQKKKLSISHIIKQSSDPVFTQFN